MLDDGDDMARADEWKAGGWGAMLRAPIYARTPEQAIHILFALQGVRKMSWWENLMKKGER